jgi:hypothetical protein
MIRLIPPERDKKENTDAVKFHHPIVPSCHRAIVPSSHVLDFPAPSFGIQRPVDPCTGFEGRGKRVFSAAAEVPARM